MQENRRDFLKKSLKIGTVATAAGVAATSLMAGESQEKGSSGVVRGKAKKKEVLYYKSEAWAKYYNVAY